MPLALLPDPTNIGNAPGDGPLRAGGQNLPGLTRPDDDLPSTLSHAAKQQREALTLVRDLWRGNERIKDKGETYLPRAPREPAEAYVVRLKRAALYNVFRNTIVGLTGFLFREPPKLGDDVPAQLQADWENLDNAGTHGDVFARDIAADAMCAGHAAILVEYPRTTPAPNAKAEQGTRPYWVPLTKDQLVSWRTAVEDGRLVLTQLVVEECQHVPRGAFGETEQKRYRVFQRNRATPTAPPAVTWQLLEVTEDKQVLVVGEGAYPTQEEIPVAEVVTPGKISLFCSEPPFIDLAHLNLAHYRQWSDYDTSIHKTCVPLLFTAGFGLTDAEGTEQVVGPNTALDARDPQAKAEYVTHDGAALDQCRQSLTDLENRMAALGLAALATQKRAAETATAKELDKGATDAALAVCGRGIEDALERALGFHARYYRLPSGGSVEVNTNFADLTMAPEVMSAWASLATALSLPARVVIEALITGGRLPEDTDVEALALEMEAAAEAERQRKAAELQMTLEAKAKAPPAKMPMAA